MASTLYLEVADNEFGIQGGPYQYRPKSMFGVCAAAEIKLPCDVYIPTADFRVPDTRVLNEALPVIFKALFDRGTIYVGCMGGIGRTGLIMAIMAKVWGVDDPIRYVRQQYHTRAIETFEQEDFVEDFIVPWKLWLYVRVKKLIIQCF